MKAVEKQADWCSVSSYVSIVLVCCGAERVELDASWMRCFGDVLPMFAKTQDTQVRLYLSASLEMVSSRRAKFCSQGKGNLGASA